jgi:phosphoserine aminotransferase
LLGLDDSFDVLFLQGGARLQFSMVPINLLRGRKQSAQYVLTGSWGKSALEEARREGEIEVIFDAKPTNYDRLPDWKELQIRDDAAYVHITSNETIQGVQFPGDMDSGTTPLVCDASSDFLYRPYEMASYGVLYACAQKNAGPAGVTVVVIKRELLDRSGSDLPGYLSYKNHSEADSMWNTPPVFAVYALGLVVQWLEDTVGGLDRMLERNQRKANLLYELLDAYPDLYCGHARRQDRSLMNVTFRLPNDEIEAAFLSAASEQGLTNLKGHRSVGGIRASIYNAMPVEGVSQLADFMRDFANKHS